jgi:hypothetical protein
MVLLSTVSCSTLPIDVLAFDECDLSSGLVTEEQVLPRELVTSKGRREEAKARREQPGTSATPRVVPVRANATIPSGSGDASKKTSTPPRSDARKEQQLFNEFLEWRNRQIGPL